MTRNSDDLQKEFNLSWEKEIGVTYENWLEKEIQKVENETEEYRRFAERLSLEIHRISVKNSDKSWVDLTQQEPIHTGYYLVIADVACEFGGYRTVLPAHYATNVKNWAFCLGYENSIPLAYKPFPLVPKKWEEK